MRSIEEVHQASPAQVAAAQIVLSNAEVFRLEKLGDEADVDTLREWGKEMA